MPTADEYRTKAAELNTRARQDADPASRRGYENLARSYLRLAEQAEKNAANDMVYETPRKANVQQQQQIQPDKKDER